MTIFGIEHWSTTASAPSLAGIAPGFIVKLQHRSSGERFWVTVLNVSRTSFMGVVCNTCFNGTVDIGDYVLFAGNQVLEFPGRSYDLRLTMDMVRAAMAIPRQSRIAMELKSNVRYV